MGSLKKIVAFLLCAVLLMGVMAGCAQKEPAQETTSENETTQTEVKANETETTNETKEPVVEKKTIKFWNGFTGSDQETLTKRIEEYNAGDHSATIEMEIMPWDTLYEKLATTVSSGEGPDVVAFSFQRIGTYAREGVIVPVNDVFDNGVDKDVIPAGLLDNLNYGDDVYATPMNLSTMMLYYNKDLLAEAGLETPPANWDELSEYAKQLTKVNGDIVEQYGFGIASHVTVAMWPVLLWTGGGDIVDYSTMTSVLNSDANKYTMTYFSDLIKEYKVSPAVAAGADIDTLFQTGKCAMYMCGPWAVAGFQSAGLNFDVAPVPEGPGGAATLGDSVVLCMTANGEENKAEVYDFMSWWNSKENQAAWVAPTGFAPTRTDMAEEIKDNHFISAFSSVSNDAHFYLPKLTNFGEVEESVLTPMYESILLGEATVDEALQTADAQLNELLNDQ